MPIRALAAAERTSDWTGSEPRRELKYAGPAAASDTVERLLVSLCRPDPAHPENRVHSVYFDTPDLAAYGDKADGQFRKAKLRLRWYEQGSGHAWLERKVRTGARGEKLRKRVAFHPPHGVADVGAFAALAREHAAPLPPVLWLSYRRLRLVLPDGSARVALDRDIRAHWVSPLVAARRPLAPLPFFVVEVKGDAPEPPAWLARLLGRYARRRAISKYGACLEQARGGAL